MTPWQWGWRDTKLSRAEMATEIVSQVQSLVTVITRNFCHRIHTHHSRDDKAHQHTVNPRLSAAQPWHRSKNRTITPELSPSTSGRGRTAVRNDEDLRSGNPTVPPTRLRETPPRIQPSRFERTGTIAHIRTVRMGQFQRP